MRRVCRRWADAVSYALFFAQSARVLAYFERLVDPFPDAPPKYVRAVVYEYRFTSLAEKRATGAWWKREYRGVYLPPLDLEDFARQQ